MGRVAGAYGVRGWIKVAPGGGAAEQLASAAAWWIGERRFPVAQAKLHSGSVVASLAGITSREEALALKGAEVALERAALPDPGKGHYYLADLVGLEVWNRDGERLGEVRRLFWNGAQDVAEVVGSRMYLLPWVAAVVKEVDLAAGRVEVEWGADW